MYTITLPKHSNTIVLHDVGLSGPADSVDTHLILDTGAGYSMISWNDAARLEFMTYPTLESHLDHYGQWFCTGACVLILKSIQLGDIQVQKYSCHLSRYSRGCTKHEGFYGLEFSQSTFER